MKILFFTPFAARNGAEMMLWYLMKYANPLHFTCAIYSFKAGDLLADLPSSIPYFTPPVPTVSFTKRVANKLKNKISPPTTSAERAHILAVHAEIKPDIWYINTILCPQATELAIELGIPYVVHFHELLLLYQHVSYQHLKNMVQGAALLFGCSEVVCEKLRIMGNKNVALQYECIDIDNIRVDEANALRIRRLLGIESTFTWVMSGSVEYRKGTDLLPSIAQELGPEATILWLGPGSSGYSYYVEQELKHRGIHNVRLLGPKTQDYYDYLSIADGLILTSREDPFPLVMIEAAAMGKPIAALNSGGVIEFVKEGMGIVVDLDSGNLIEAMRKIMNGEIGFEKETAINRANEFDVKYQVKLWQNEMLARFNQ